MAFLSASAGGQSVEIGAVNWLSFEDDWAHASSPPNGALGIDGRAYAYGDECAELHWDPVTRCASGTLCSPGPDYEYWGVSIGFDFRNTGDFAVPPNSRLTWNPEELGAEGIAWKLTGSMSALQVWILNMDPAYRGECNAASCEIKGPPDGTGVANLEDELLFSDLIKDDWGNSGISYTFDPAAVSTVQFKLSTTVFGPETFEFCLEQLGVRLR